ncbi:MAG: class I SAM-dependent methyltransferase [Nanoarchaeota archaeon]|nr:class I SAM-dependent methyltransferase [Nanoarchaeota archaeon]
MSKYLESCKTKFWRDVFEKELEYILSELKGYKNVLSVGCGPAIIERGLQENDFNVTGLDVSKIALDGATDNIRTIAGSAENMDYFEDSTFDAAIYIASLQFIDNYEKAVQETARVLRAKGRVLVMLLNPRSKFFKGKRKQSDSYINKIKHPYLTPIEKVISDYFNSIKAEYYLGAKGQEIFESQDSKLAALYIVQGRKK